MEVRTEGPAIVTTVAPAIPRVDPIDLLAAESSLPAGFARASWGAILAGAAVASVSMIVLDLLGLGIGAFLWKPGTEGGTTYKVVGLIYLLFTTAASMLAGGYVAGWASAMPARKDRALHGVVAWGVATLAAVALLLGGVTRIGSAALAGALPALRTPAADATADGDAAAPDRSPRADRAGATPREVRELLGVDVRRDPTLRASIDDAVRGEASPQERERLVDDLGQRTGKSRAEIDDALDSWSRRASGDQATTDVAISPRKAERAADAVGTASLLGVCCLLLGLTASTLGAAGATPSGAHTRRRTVVKARS